MCAARRRCAREVGGAAARADGEEVPERSAVLAVVQQARGAAAPFPDSLGQLRIGNVGPSAGRLATGRPRAPHEAAAGIPWLPRRDQSRGLEGSGWTGVGAPGRGRRESARATRRRRRQQSGSWAETRTSCGRGPPRARTRSCCKSCGREGWTGRVHTGQPHDDSQLAQQRGAGRSRGPAPRGRRGWGGGGGGQVAKEPARASCALTLTALPTRGAGRARSPVGG